MTPARQLAYLDALGIPVWVRKPAAPEAPEAAPWGIRLGPGAGDCLLLCEDASAPPTRLATDIARALAGEPVWCWPDRGEESQSPAAAVDAHLFTALLVFGDPLARRVFGDNLPDAVGSARLVVVPGMAELATRAEARRRLWRCLAAGSPGAGQ